MEERAVYKPGGRYVTKLLIIVLVVFAVFVLPWVLFGLMPELGWFYVAIFLGANVLWLIPTLILLPVYCRTISYELAEDEVIVRKGLLTRTVKRVPYRMVTNLEVRRGILDRWLGLGSIALHTAGYSQQSGAEGSLVGLATYEVVHERVAEALKACQSGAAVVAAVADADAVTVGNEESRHKAETAILIEILHELRALRQGMATRR